MAQIKILRAELNSTQAKIKIYCADENGKANVPDYWLVAYVDALKVVDTFEKMVDEQYEKS